MTTNLNYILLFIILIYIVYKNININITDHFTTEAPLSVSLPKDIDFNNVTVNKSKKLISNTVTCKALNIGSDDQSIIIDYNICKSLLQLPIIKRDKDETTQLCLAKKDGSGNECIDSTHFKNLKTFWPKGTIIAYYGKLPIPNGWTLCDGTNNTPDLRKKFILGATTDNTINKSQGDSFMTHTLTLDEIPTHQHNLFSNSPGFECKQSIVDGHFRTGISAGIGAKNPIDYYPSESNGGGLPHNNMPPYLSIYYIMRTENTSNQIRPNIRPEITLSPISKTTSKPKSTTIPTKPTKSQIPSYCNTGRKILNTNSQYGDKRKCPS